MTSRYSGYTTHIPSGTTGVVYVAYNSFCARQSPSLAIYGFKDTYECFRFLQAAIADTTLGAVVVVPPVRPNMYGGDFSMSPNYQKALAEGRMGGDKHTYDPDASLCMNKGSTFNHLYGNDDATKYILHFYMCCVQNHFYFFSLAAVEAVFKLSTHTAIGKGLYQLASQVPLKTLGAICIDPRAKSPTKPAVKRLIEAYNLLPASNRVEPTRPHACTPDMAPHPKREFSINSVEHGPFMRAHWKAADLFTSSSISDSSSTAGSSQPATSLSSQPATSTPTATATTATPHGASSDGASSSTASTSQSAAAAPAPAAGEWQVRLSGVFTAYAEASTQHALEAALHTRGEQSVRVRVRGTEYIVQSVGSGRFQQVLASDATTVRDVRRHVVLEARTSPSTSTSTSTASTAGTSQPATSQSSQTATSTPAATATTATPHGPSSDAAVAAAVDSDDDFVASVRGKKQKTDISLQPSFIEIAAEHAITPAQTVDLPNTLPNSQSTISAEVRLKTAEAQLLLMQARAVLAEEQVSVMQARLAAAGPNPKFWYDLPLAAAALLPSSHRMPFLVIICLLGLAGYIMHVKHSNHQQPDVWSCESACMCHVAGEGGQPAAGEQHKGSRENRWRLGADSWYVDPSRPLRQRLAAAIRRPERLWSGASGAV